MHLYRKLKAMRGVRRTAAVRRSVVRGVSLFMLCACCLLMAAPGNVAGQSNGCNKLATVFGKLEKEYFLGYGMLSMDVNRDGELDLLVSARGANTVFVYYGGQGIFDTTVDLTLHGGAEMAQGDFNGDGLTDIAVHAADYRDTPSSPSGMIYHPDSVFIHPDSLFIYMGREDTPYTIDTVPRYRMEGARETSSGETKDWGSILLAGDLDGDGADELVIGGVDFIAEPRHFGVLDIWKYRNGLPADSLERVDMKSGIFARFMYWVRMGDVNGDGLQDLVYASAEKYAMGEADLSNVYVKFGREGTLPIGVENDQTLSWDLLWPKYAHDSGAFDLLDVNNDGMDDFLWNQLNAGTPEISDSLSVMYGTPEGLSGRVDRIVTNPNPRRWHGGLGGQRIGDYNGDGYRDYALLWGVGYGDCSAHIVYLGDEHGLTNEAPAACWGCGYYYWRCIVPMGDLTGDGADEYVVSNPIPPSYPDDPIADGHFTVVLGERHPVLEVEELQDEESDQNMALSLSVYPLPAESGLHLRIGSLEGGTHTLSVYGLDGSLRHRRSVDLHAGENFLTLEPADFLDEQPGAGVYMLEVTRGESRAVRKIMLR